MRKLKSPIKFLLLSVLFLIAVASSCSENEKADSLGLVPEPQYIETGDGAFTVNDSTVIVVLSEEPETDYAVNYFKKRFEEASGIKLRYANKADENYILFALPEPGSELGKEGYELKADEKGISIYGKPAGMFYAVQTLFQLLPEKIYSQERADKTKWSVPFVVIKDKPRFAWRGMHLDVGRHFFPVDFVKRYIDFLAMHKLNVFHWHLTEDQGWRIEIKKYPRLTKVGAWRKGTQIGKTAEIDSVRYGGYYTQDEIREVVKYAAERFITVVPEIEMPGHSRAALASYPELSCTGGPFEVATHWGVEPDIYCAGNDSVFVFLEDVLTEVMDLFPSKYIHIGGDEAPKIRWQNCEKCQARIKEEGLKDESELQSYFIERIEKFLNAHGRSIIGWDEILEGGLAPNAAVMSWRGVSGGIAAAKQKHFVVMSPTSHCYFDYYQGPREIEPLAIGGYLPLEKVYSYEPVPDELNDEEAKYIMGVQANLWTEYIATTEYAEYMALPRMCALAEVAWTFPARKDSVSFLKRMTKHYYRLDELNAHYRWPQLSGLRANNVFIGSDTLKLKSQFPDAEIRYTTDGSEPERNSLLYTEPVVITESVTIKVKEFKPNGKSGKTYVTRFEKQTPLSAIKIDKTKNGLKYELFELNEIIGTTDEISNLSAISQGETNGFKLPEGDDVPYRFAVKYYGYLEIPATDVYEFSAVSDDGTKLFIDGKEVVNNDGQHGAIEKSGQIALEKGMHEIYLEYFQVGGGKFLKVYFGKKGEKKKELSETELFIR